MACLADGIPVDSEDDMIYMIWIPHNCRTAMVEAADMVWKEKLFASCQPDILQVIFVSGFGDHVEMHL